MNVDQQWLERLKGVSAAQSRYLWALVVCGVLFWSIHASLLSEVMAEPQALTVPLLGVDLSPWIVWAAGPATLFFLLLVIIGSMRAYGSAYNRLEETVHEGESESLDVVPNAIDLAVYTDYGSSVWQKRLFSLSYPALLTVFLVEGIWMLRALRVNRNQVVGSWVFIVIGIVTGVAATLALFPLWVVKLRGRMTGANAVPRA